MRAILFDLGDTLVDARNQPLPGASKRQVAVIPFTAELLPRCGRHQGSDFLQFYTVGFADQPAG